MGRRLPVGPCPVIFELVDVRFSIAVLFPIGFIFALYLTVAELLVELLTGDGI